MRTLLGVLRISVAFLIIVFYALLILLAAPVPLYLKKIRLAPWLCTGAARLAMALFNVRFYCAELQTIDTHQGFIFANHISYFDILMLLNVLPMRFLSRLENRSWPFIGWVAVAVGTVFVNRDDKQSRAQARRQLAQAGRFPPIVLYPEGGIGPAHNLRPFRYGAFELAVAEAIPYLPCAIVYDRPEVLAWGDESFLAALWRLACRTGPIQARLVPLAPIRPKPDDDPKQLAVEAHRAIAAVLGVEPKM